MICELASDTKKKKSFFKKLIPKDVSLPRYRGGVCRDSGEGDTSPAATRGQAELS